MTPGAIKNPRKFHHYSPDRAAIGFRAPPAATRAAYSARLWHNNA